jgi:hypothetical protein
MSIHSGCLASSFALRAASHFRSAQGCLPEPGGTTMSRFLARVGRARDAHVLGTPCTGGDLSALEKAIGAPLPSEFRELLRAFGGAILYDRHELFGPYRVLLHDIEMVPDLLSVRASLQRDGRLAAHLLPFHRAGDTVHALDLSAASAETAPVVPLDGDRRHRSLGVFLAEVVLPRAPETR